MVDFSAVVYSVSMRRFEERIRYTGRKLTEDEDYYESVGSRHSDCMCVVDLHDAPRLIRAVDFTCCECSSWLANCTPKQITIAEACLMRGGVTKSALCLVCTRRIGCDEVFMLGGLCDDCASRLFKYERSARATMCLVMSLLGRDIARNILSCALSLPFT